RNEVTSLARTRSRKTLQIYPGGTRVSAAMRSLVCAAPSIDARYIMARSAYSTVWENMEAPSMDPGSRRSFGAACFIPLAAEALDLLVLHHLAAGSLALGFSGILRVERDDPRSHRGGQRVVDSGQEVRGVGGQPAPCAVVADEDFDHGALGVVGAVVEQAA